ncbi:kinase-like domain-containing protein [Flagelloscypha sp. PMI_526]|nr:kinase-like domain-containing protein [Flagelloscypha sp. PMI_526]
MTVEILPLQDSCWVLNLHSSESLRDLVLADESINLTGIKAASLSEARAVMILLDYVLSCFQWCARHLRRLHRAIRTITTTFGERCLPPAFYLSGVLHDGNDAIGGGGYSNVLQDTFKGTLGKKVVCLKVPRVFVSSGPTERKKSLQVFLDEAIIWRHLRHPNVLPFLGISQNAFAHRTCFVSPFMANGDLMQFLKRNPGHDRIVCLYEIAKGLQYLHASYIYHGDVKGANVLVDDNNCCRLADFGITSLICTNTATTDLATITSTKGSNRWMAPEVFDPASYKNSSRVRAAPRDVYAFACTSLEVMTGKPPFPERPEPAAMVSVLQGERPERPHQIECLTDVLWNLIERCWAQKPEARPTFDDITITMGGVINQERT